MGEEHTVDVGIAARYRKPARDVWTTTTKVRKLDPHTGRARSVKIAIVRWRRIDARMGIGLTQPDTNPWLRPELAAGPVRALLGAHRRP